MTNQNLKMKEPANEENLGSFYMGRMKPSTPPRRVLPKGALTFTTLFAFVAILWYAYPRGQERYSDIDIPVITADKAVYKFKPDDPGGMEVLHQDSTVFDPLEKKSDDTVQKVRPKPEEPMVKPEAAKSAPIDKTPHELELKEVSHGSEKIISAPEPAPVKKEEPKVEAKAAPVAIKPVETAKTEAKSALLKTEATKTAATKPSTAKTQIAKTDPLKGEAVPAIESVNAEPLDAPFADKPVLQTAAALNAAKSDTKLMAAPTEAKPVIAKVETKPVAAPVKAEAKPAVKPAVSPSSNVTVQFGAYRENKGAQEQWHVLQKKFPELMKGLVMRTTIASGKKGALTHLQAGNIPMARAKEICSKLEAGKEACMIVHD
jgi:hypothetical protein